MEGIGGTGTDNAESMSKNQHDVWKVYQNYLDKTTLHSNYRWIGTLALVAIYFLRVYYVQRFYIVTYCLVMFVQNLLIQFLSPLDDPERTSDEPMLQAKNSDESKPFIRQLPEFGFWYSMTKAFIVAFLMSFFSVFDFPMFWPIVLFYWCVLFSLTNKRKIAHMIKHKCVPLSIRKQKQS